MAQTKAQLLGPVVGDVVMDVSTLSLDAEGNKVGIGTTEADLTLHVNGINGLPSSSGSTPTGHLTLRNKSGSASHGMFMGVSDAAPYSSWIQAQDANNNATNYPLLLNPNGGKVGIGTSASPNNFLHVVGNDYQTLRLENTDGGANGPYIELYNNSSSPANDDYIGIISFKNRNSNNEEITYSQIRSQSVDVADGAEDGNITFHTRLNGSFGERLRIIENGMLGIGHHSAAQITKELTIRPVDDGGIMIGRPGDTVTPINAHLLLTTTTSGSVFPTGEGYTVKYNTRNCDSIFTTFEGGGTGGNISFQTGVGNGNAIERLRINSGGDISIGGLASPRAKLDIEDAGTSKDVILRVSADDNNPYALVVANDTFNTTSNRGLAFWIGSNTVHHIEARTSTTSSENELMVSAGSDISFRTNVSSERFRIHSTGVPQFTTTGTQYPSATVPAFVVNSSGDHALVLNNQNTTDPRGLFIYQDQDVNNGTSYFLRARAGGTDRAHLYSNGNLSLAGGISAKDYVNLTDIDTSARLNVQTDIGGNYTGWKEKGVASGSMSQTSIDSKTPTINDFTYPNSSNGMLIWSTSKIGFAAGSESPQYGTGVQMLYDATGIALGGYRAFDRTDSVSAATNANIKLYSQNGNAIFKGIVQANPLRLTSSDSWINSSYGAISNSTVSSLNNLLIGQNMRGYISGQDGGSNNNNFYSIVTYGAGSMGHAGTEYCFGGTTKFYNDTAASTANTTFSPTVSMQINGNGHVTQPKNPSFAATWSGSNTAVSVNSQMQFDSVIHNIGNHYSTSTYRFTAPVSGSYQINFYSIWYQQTISNAAVYLYKNGSRIYGGDIHFSADFSTNKWHNVSYSIVQYLNSGDYIYMQNGSVAITYHGRNWSRFSGYLLG